MGDLSRGERLQIMLARDELKAIDDWRFTRRMPTRASAIRELLQRGLAAEGFTLANSGSQSKQFGVLERPKADKTRAVPKGRPTR